MPLFKKIIVTLFLIFIFLFGFYYAVYDYLIQIDKSYCKITDFNIIKEYAFNHNLYKLTIEKIYNGFIDSIVYIFTFKYNDIDPSVKFYFMFVLIVSFPSVFTLFKYLTFRGFKAFKLAIKKAAANPFFYEEWKESNKVSTHDNLDDVAPELYLILIPIRVVLLVFIILVLPILMLMYIAFSIAGIIKGFLRAGCRIDFD